MMSSPIHSQLVSSLTPESAFKLGLKRLEAIAQAKTTNNRPVWMPNPGPQTLAYESTADIIGYGGAAGGGKSFLGLGLAAMKHRRSVIYRREFPSLSGLIEDSRLVLNPKGNEHSKDSYNEQLHRWRLHDPDRLIQFWSINDAGDLQKKKGNPFDLMVFDEGTEYPESFVRFMMGWNRTAIPGLHCQTLITFNPPMDEAGEWVTRFFLPWLAFLAPTEYQYERPAAPGELRWFAMVDGKEIEVDEQPFTHNGETIVPKSRTFIPASLDDNPILKATGYGATIDAMPAEYRDVLRGKFGAGRSANPLQVISTALVRAAMARWTPEPPKYLDAHGKEQPAAQTALGADIARGGVDDTTLAILHGVWYAPIIRVPGRETPTGPIAAQIIVNYLHGGVIGIDVIGIGASAYDSLRQMGVSSIAINFGEATRATDKTGRLQFRNVRAAAYWFFREALEAGEVMLPDDTGLLIELTAARLLKDELQGGKVALEPKEEIKKRIGRSPDSADAVVMAWYAARMGGVMVAFG